tara:strand:+ start:59 stop:202 length:144 start_codon:yes stop_codon:yes gene_type:complete
MTKEPKFKIWFYNVINKDVNIFTGTKKQWKEFSNDLNVTVKKRKLVK